MRFHLLTPVMRPGDAISNDVLGMRRWLLDHGFPARAYAEHCHPQLRRIVWPLKAYAKHRVLHAHDDVLIYHHSTGWPAGFELFGRGRHRKVIKYHNITPPEFFERYSPKYAVAARRGMEHTRRLVEARPEVLTADSPYNRQELVAYGAEPGHSHAVAPFHQIGEFDDLPLMPELDAELRPRVNLLFVGRLAPNKGYLHLVRAFAHYHHHVAAAAHLWLVGGFDVGFRRYQEEVVREIHRHRLQGRVHIPGAVTDRQLKTLYAHAQVFLCASEHEGFCVPLVEAMYYRVPIVAYGSSAVPGTLGDAGLVWDTPSPVLFAESIRVIRERPEVRAALVQAQWERYQSHFSPAAIGRQFEHALAPIFEEASVHA